MLKFHSDCKAIPVLVEVTTLNEATQACCRSGTVRILTATRNTATIDVLVMQGKSLDFDLLLSIDAIKALGGVRITQSGSVKFEETSPVCAELRVNKSDFSVKFNVRQGVWVAASKWSAGRAQGNLGTGSMNIRCLAS